MINEGTNIHRSVAETGITVVDMSSDLMSLIAKLTMAIDATTAAAKVDTAIVRTRRFRANRYHTRITMAALRMLQSSEYTERGDDQPWQRAINTADRI